MDNNIEINPDSLEKVAGGAGPKNFIIYKTLTDLENAPFFDKLLSQLGFMKNRGYDRAGAQNEILNYITDTEGASVLPGAMEDFMNKYW